MIYDQNNVTNILDFNTSHLYFRLKGKFIDKCTVLKLIFKYHFFFKSFSYQKNLWL